MTDDERLKRLERQRRWTKANPDKVKELRSRHRNTEKGRSYQQAYHKTYHQQHRDKITENSRQHYAANKELIQHQNRERYANNRKVAIQRSHNYKMKRLKEDPLFLCKDRLRRAVYGVFTRIKKNKPAPTQELLGCTWQEAREHFEHLFVEGMSWDNYGEWHIDHIRPVTSFGPDELVLMNRIENLQPLWATDNIRKGSKWSSDIPPQTE